MLFTTTLIGLLRLLDYVTLADLGVAFGVYIHFVLVYSICIRGIVIDSESLCVYVLPADKLLGNGYRKLVFVAVELLDGSCRSCASWLREAGDIPWLSA